MSSTSYASRIRPDYQTLYRLPSYPDSPFSYRLATMGRCYTPNLVESREFFKPHLFRNPLSLKCLQDILSRIWNSSHLIFVYAFVVHPVNGEVPPVKGRPWKLPHYANRGKTSSSGGELASARSCFSTVRTALGKLRITGLLARFDVARSFPQFPRPLLLQPTIWTSERGADLGSGRCQPRPHLPIYRMTRFCSA